MKHSPTGRCRRRPRDGTRSSPRMPFHAFWWDHARLGVSVGAFADDAGALERHLASFPKEVATFADRLGDRLSAERRRIYERLVDAAPRLSARYRSHRDMTIIHGDAHVWNALVSRDDLHADVAGEPRPRRMDLVEPSGMHHGRRARSRLSRTASTGAP